MRTNRSLFATHKVGCLCSGSSLGSLALFPPDNCRRASDAPKPENKHNRHKYKVRNSRLIVSFQLLIMSHDEWNTLLICENMHFFNLNIYIHIYVFIIDILFTVLCNFCCCPLCCIFPSVGLITLLSDLNWSKCYCPVLYIHIVTQIPAQHYCLYVLHDSSISAEINAVCFFCLKWFFIICSLLSNTLLHYRKAMFHLIHFSQKIFRITCLNVLVSRTVCVASVCRRLMSRWMEAIFDSFSLYRFKNREPEHFSVNLSILFIM